jgi:hypothetical protein
MPSQQLWERLARCLGWNGTPDTIGDYLEEWQYMGPSQEGGDCFRRRAGILGPNNPPKNEYVNLCPIVAHTNDHQKEVN